jgi:hypothetical protein
MELSNIAILVIVFLLAWMGEALVEYFIGIPLSKSKFAYLSWALIYVAAAVGLIGAFVYQLDLIHIIAEQLGLAIPINYFGLIITGLSIGRGANFIHDLVMKFAKKPV